MRLTRGRSSIQSRLIRSFSVAILIPALVTAIVGGQMLRRRVFEQAQNRVDSDLESAKVILQSYLERVKDSFRIHATRMVIYGALSRNDKSGLDEEMNRILQAERLDTLTLADAGGRVFYCVRNPSLEGTPVQDEAARFVLKNLSPISGIQEIPAEELERQSPELARKAFMAVTPTPRARQTPAAQVRSGLMLCGAAPVLSRAGKILGVLYGGVLLNRNYELVDKIRETVFRDQRYQGREVGTATIFQDDVRISTNVRNEDGTRAITTRASAEVVDEVLERGSTWRGRAFVVNDWYFAAYAPLLDIRGATAGMLYVGTLERPFIDSLWRSLLVFLGIAVLGVAMVSWIAIVVARRISRPIHEMAEASQQVAQGDYSRKIAVDTDDEVGYLAESFNTMISELDRTHQELRDLAANLERKVEERTAELKTMQASLLQTEKLAAIGKLAAGVAHEINNPLTGVLTNSSLLLKDLPEDDPNREDLQTIVNETLRCRKIVKGLLDFARQTAPQKQALSLNGVVEDVLALVRNQASFRNIRIETNLDGSLPPVMVDGDQMRQVILNIVLNAAEAMPQGGDLRIDSRAGPAHVAVRISDTGGGIPEEIRDKLFEPFFTTKPTGTGLGLAIAYGIVERHKGSLSVQSEPGTGTSFTITVPRNESRKDG